MRHAVIENNIVTNIISLVPGTKSNSINAVRILDLPVTFGDEYRDGAFYHDGEKIISKSEQLRQAYETIAELDATLLNTTYESIVGGLE